MDAVHDLLRGLGDLSTAEAMERGATAEDLVELETTRRVIRVRIAGQERWLAIEDAGRVRDALGAALPVGVPEAFTEPVRDPLGDLVARYGRTHGPFHAGAVAERLGLGVAVVVTTLDRLRAAGRLVQGEFRPGAAGTEWCDAEVLRSIRRRSLAALRKEIEPVPPQTLGRFLPAWQGIGARGRGIDALMRAVEQLAGVPLPASALETLDPARPRRRLHPFLAGPVDRGRRDRLVRRGQPRRAGRLDRARPGRRRRSSCCRHRPTVPTARCTAPSSTSSARSRRCSSARSPPRPGRRFPAPPMPT